MDAVNRAALNGGLQVVFSVNACIASGSTCKPKTLLPCRSLG